jgi:hypothetical protein
MMYVMNKRRLKMDLRKINSMTKYPSILTYHALGEKGKLKEEVQVQFDEPAILTEKIDGVNARIILFPYRDDGFYIIGSREELLYGKGDLIGNPQLGIVDALKPLAETPFPLVDVLTVLYLEVYGGKTTSSSKQYTGNRTIGYRLFDIATILDYRNLLDNYEVEQIAKWRDNGGQTFYNETRLQNLSTHFLQIPLVPRLGIDILPTSLSYTHKWLGMRLKETWAPLDSDAIGRPEGIVVRSADRAKIAKLRFEDYERTLRKP